MEPLTVKMVIDYQNIHLTGHGAFVPEGHPKHESLVHPLYFAQQWLSVRNRIRATHSMRSGETLPPYALKAVAVYRGNPSNREDPKAYQRNQAQRSEWTRDSRVSVTYRTLRYTWRNGVYVAQEKGVDVMVALDFVRSADRYEADVIVLASHDTDMEPALATASENEDRTIETAGWHGCRVLRVPGHQIWHTALDGRHFVNSRDRKDYT